MYVALAMHCHWPPWVVEALDADFVEELSARIIAEGERTRAERERLRNIGRGGGRRYRPSRAGGGYYETVDVQVE